MLTSLDEYYSLGSKIGEGAFSEVFKVQQITTGQYFAAKRLTKPFHCIDEVRDYLELNMMHQLQFHPNVTQLIDHVYEIKCLRLTLIFNLMDCSLYDYIKNRKTKLSETQCKNYLFQLGHGLYYLHYNGIFHRHIKPENCLMRIDPILKKTNPLRAELIQISDLGSASYTSYPQPRSEYIATRWYRAPECLLSRGYYGSEMDIWALGCCFYEMVTLMPLFPGHNELDQLDKIHDLIGSPSKHILQKFKNVDTEIEFPRKKAVNIHTFIPMLSKYGADVLKKTLAYHPDNRISAKKLLEHVYFDDLKLKISSDTITTRLLYSKSSTSMSSREYTENLQTNSVRGKLRGKLKSCLSMNSSIRRKMSCMKNQFESLQQIFIHQRERNWNNPQNVVRRNLVKNSKTKCEKEFE